MKNLKFALLFTILGNSSFLFSQKPDWQYFSMNGNECQIFTTKGNSRIIVPANCFTLGGKPYAGILQIAFKEYKDQADFILGGLSLRYEINGSLKTLQSGGMFEIDIKTKDKAATTLGFSLNKKVVVKFAIDPKFDVAGLEPFYFDPNTKKWIKNTRFGKTKEGNQDVADEATKLWQDDPKIAQFSKDPEMSNDGDGNGCYVMSIQDPKNPSDPYMLIDTMICPPQYNPLDSKYSAYLSDQAYKSMQIDKMGLYNYDKIFKEENSVPMFVNLVGKDGKAFNFSGKMYVVYKNSNSVIYYYKDDLLKNFSLIPRDDIRIFTYNEDGSVSKVPDSFWKSFNTIAMRGKTIDLPFETVKLATLSKDELAKVTGLKNN